MTELESLEKPMSFKSKIVVSVIAIVFILFSLIGSHQSTITKAAENQACRDIGYDEKYYFDQKPICIGGDGEATFVKIDCEGWFENTFCKSTPIEIGTYRITQE